MRARGEHVATRWSPDGQEEEKPVVSTVYSQYVMLQLEDHKGFKWKRTVTVTSTEKTLENKGPADLVFVFFAEAPTGLFLWRAYAALVLTGRGSRKAIIKGTAAAEVAPQ